MEPEANDRPAPATSPTLEQQQPASESARAAQATKMPSAAQFVLLLNHTLECTNDACTSHPVAHPTYDCSRMKDFLVHPQLCPERPCTKRCPQCAKYKQLVALHARACDKAPGVCSLALCNRVKFDLYLERKRIDALRAAPSYDVPTKREFECRHLRELHAHSLECPASELCGVPSCGNMRRLMAHHPRTCALRGHGCTACSHHCKVLALHAEECHAPAKRCKVGDGCDRVRFKLFLASHGKDTAR